MFLGGITDLSQVRGVWRNKNNSIDCNQKVASSNPVLGSILYWVLERGPKWPPSRHMHNSPGGWLSRCSGPKLCSHLYVFICLEGALQWICKNYKLITNYLCKCQIKFHFISKAGFAPEQPPHHWPQQGGFGVPGHPQHPSSGAPPGPRQPLRQSLQSLPCTSTSVIISVQICHIMPAT